MKLGTPTQMNVAVLEAAAVAGIKLKGLNQNVPSSPIKITPLLSPWAECEVRSYRQCVPNVHTAIFRYGNLKHTITYTTASQWFSFRHMDSHSSILVAPSNQLGISVSRKEFHSLKVQLVAIPCYKPTVCFKGSPQELGFCVQL